MRNPFTEWRDSGYALPGGMVNESKDVQFQHKSATSRFDPGLLRVLRMACIRVYLRDVSDVLDDLLTVQFEGLDDRDRTYSGLPFLIR